VRRVACFVLPLLDDVEVLSAERIRPDDAPPVTVSARTGRVIWSVGAAQAGDIAQEFMRSASPVTVATLVRDQWIVSSEFDLDRPLHVVSFDDVAATHLYVSSRDAAIVLDTTAHERRWNWIGAVMHWFYFSELRAHPAAWRQVVLWTPGVGIVVAMNGIWLGIDRLRLRRRAPGGSMTPLRGWAAWHHIAGVLGGVFVLTWIFRAASFRRRATHLDLCRSCLRRRARAHRCLTATASVALQRSAQLRLPMAARRSRRCGTS
jgi:hypothetical protein